MSDRWWIVEWLSIRIPLAILPRAKCPPGNPAGCPCREYFLWLHRSARLLADAADGPPSTNREYERPNRFVRIAESRSKKRRPGPDAKPADEKWRGNPAFGGRLCC